MSSAIKHISLDRLVPHPGNPNRMSRANFEKLVRNMERTGRYEPLVVRPCPARRGFFQIINGHHRCEALRKLGHKTADALVWKVDDEQADILLATLNRLNGRDTLDKKLALLRRLSRRIPIRKLARLLPQTLGQLTRLTASGPPVPTRAGADSFAIPMVFFVDPAQQHAIEEALSLGSVSPEAGTRAAKRAAALTRVARHFLDRPSDGSRGRSSAAPPATQAGPADRR